MANDILDVGDIAAQALDAQERAYDNGAPMPAPYYNPSDVKSTGSGTMTNKQRDAIIADSQRQGYMTPPEIHMTAGAQPVNQSLPLSRQTSRGTQEEHTASTAELEAMIEQNRRSSQAFQRALLGGSTAEQTSASAIIGAGDSAASAALIQGQIDLAKTLRTQQINQVLDSSISDPDGTIVSAQKQRKEAQIKMDALRPVIDAEDQVTLWDDPLRWIANQFTLPTLKTAYNAANSQDRAMVARIAQTQEASRAQQVIDPANTVDQIGQKAAAQALELKYTALANASKLQADSSNYTARALQQDMVFNDRSFEQRMQLATLYRQSQIYSRATDADAKQSAADARQQGLVDLLSTKLQGTLGMPGVDVPTLKAGGPKREAELIAWGQKPTLGDGPGDSLRAIREFGTDQQFAATQTNTWKFLRNIITGTDYKAFEDKRQGDARFQSLPKAEQREQIVQEVYEKQLADLSKVHKGDNSSLDAANPYKLVHLNSMQIPSLAGNEFAKDVPVIAATSSDKVTVRDKDMLLSLLGKVQAEPGKLKEHVAALSEYYNTAMLNQWKTGGAMMTGYPRPQNYGVKDPKSSTIVNVMNPLELENWTTRALTSNLYRNTYSNSVDIWR